MATDRRPSDRDDVPLGIRAAREQPAANERPSSEEDFGIPGSEEARNLGTGHLPPTASRHEEDLDRPQPQRITKDRIVDDRNVAVDGARDRD